jgi:hypothetical protein
MPSADAILRIPADVGDALRGAIEVADRALAMGHGVEELAEHLYVHWYAAPVEKNETPFDLPTDLAAAMRATHAGSEVWESGWVTEQVGTAADLIVRRGEERRTLDRCDYVAPPHPGVAASPGTRLLVPARRDHLDGDGWWYTHSPGWKLDAPDGPLTRLYWNIGAAAAPTLVAALTGLLIDAEVPWMLKCAANSEAYARPDAAVLYLPAGAIDKLAGRLEQTHAELNGLLRGGAPPLTLRVRHGLAACDDPGTGESFGQHRTRLIAEAVLAAPTATASESNGDVVLGSICERFSTAEIPIERPYLANAARSLPWE